MINNAFWQGVKDSLPTMLGYFPASIAFGLTGTNLGLHPLELLGISVLMYAGSAQFFILVSLQYGIPLVNMVLFVFFLNLRHLLYGPIIEPYLPQGLKKRLAKAFLLTDEVFALCYLTLKKIPKAQKSQWYMAVGLCSWWSWIAGTAVGIFAGDYFLSHYPLLAKTMPFALTALFVSVTLLVTQSFMLLALGVGVGVSVLLTALGYDQIAILVGAAVACIVYHPPRETQVLDEEKAR